LAKLKTIYHNSAYDFRKLLLEVTGNKLLGSQQYCEKSLISLQK